MEFLSLQEPVPRAGPRITRTDALAISLAVHLLALLLFLFVPGHLPASVRAFFEPASPAVNAARRAAATPPSMPPEARQPALPKIPLKFAYVKIPNDTPAPKNPNSPLLSDKNRRARQAVPTPPDARRFSIDPHSVGNSLDRVLPDPSRPEGPESPEPPEPSTSGAASAASGRAQAPQGKGSAGSRSGAGTTVGQGVGLVAGREGGPAGAKVRSGEGQGIEGTAGSSEDLKQALHDLRSGEYKFIFNNPAYLHGGSYGTMSFDTQDFPWGDYARRLYVTIRNNWLARIPLAAREGIRGYVCWRFVIEKDGTVSQIILVQPSSVPPFDKAASDAIRASSPVPPLPENFTEPREGVTFCFFYNMAPGEID